MQVKVTTPRRGCRRRRRVCRRHARLRHPGRRADRRVRLPAPRRPGRHLLDRPDAVSATAASRRPDQADRARRADLIAVDQSADGDRDQPGHRPHRHRRGDPAAGRRAGPGPIHRPAVAVPGRRRRQHRRRGHRRRPALACWASQEQKVVAGRGTRRSAPSRPARAPTSSKRRSPAPTEAIPPKGLNIAGPRCHCSDGPAARSFCGAGAGARACGLSTSASAATV